ncbi:MAG TPA: Cna B-type [Cyanobacteria bacterium UBA8803]|nr:Cna B-type [Cyanobacteria bacterium UBA9273]HBL61463.1 Cna B-type [Cyanobacteria bacterium UBA8803]
MFILRMCINTLVALLTVIATIPVAAVNANPLPSETLANSASNFSQTSTASDTALSDASENINATVPSVQPKTLSNYRATPPHSSLHILVTDAALSNTPQNINSPLESVKGEITTPDRTSLNLPPQLNRSTTDPLLVGVIINKREVGALEVLQEQNTFLIPLEAFSEITGFSIGKVDNILKINTPLGTVDLADSDLKQINGVQYISENLIKDKLATNIEFNQSELALIIDPPWRRTSSKPSPITHELEPEFQPPSTSFSTLRQELNFTSNFGGQTGSNSQRYYSSTTLGGRLAGGSWRIRVNNDFVNAPDITEYFWFKRDGNLRYQVGRQQVGLHPLLSGIDLTGGQLAWTNLSSEQFSQGFSASALLPRRSAPLKTFRGEAPPASIVQLRINGIVVAQQQVALNGQYEFLDVSTPSGQASQVEVFIYDRNNLEVPIEIRSSTLSTSDLLLPPGKAIHLAGVGVSGSLVRDISGLGSFSSREAGDLVAFYQWRQGISENFTLEAALQKNPDTFQAEGGFTWRVADPLILAAGVGLSNGKVGYTADLEFQSGDLRIVGNSQLFPAGYDPNRESGDRFNHSLDISYKVSNNLRLGLIARSRQDEDTSTNYILPSFFWQPFRGLSLMGRPDLDGDYLFDSFFQVTRDMRLTFNTTVGDASLLDFTYRLSPRYQVSLGSNFGGELAPRYYATISRTGKSLRSPSLNLGLAMREGQVGLIAGASMEVMPGVLARIQYQGLPSGNSTGIDGFNDNTLTIGLVTDLNYSQGSFTPASTSSIGQTQGAIAGKIQLEEGAKLPNFNLDGVTIRISRGSQTRTTTTDSEGNFFIGNLPEGVYLVELDPENLPFELSPVKNTLTAEVAAAAITQFNFDVRAEFGLAGRVTDVASKPIPGVTVELINASGKPVKSTVTDQFGLYRLDGVPIGTYTLQLPTQDALPATTNLPTRMVDIQNSFLFDQNLQLPGIANFY